MFGYIEDSGLLWLLPVLFMLRPLFFPLGNLDWQNILMLQVMIFNNYFHDGGCY